MFSLDEATLACDVVAKLLPAYATKTLAETQRSRVDLHLSKCPLCAEKLRTIRAELSVAVRSGSWIKWHLVAERKLGCDRST